MLAPPSLRHERVGEEHVRHDVGLQPPVLLHELQRDGPILTREQAQKQAFRRLALDRPEADLKLLHRALKMVLDRGGSGEDGQARRAGAVPDVGRAGRTMQGFKGRPAHLGCDELARRRANLVGETDGRGFPKARDLRSN